MCEEECSGFCKKDPEIMCSKCLDNYIQKEVMKAEYKSEEIREDFFSK